MRTRFENSAASRRSNVDDKTARTEKMRMPEKEAVALYVKKGIPAVTLEVGDIRMAISPPIAKTMPTQKPNFVKSSTDTLLILSCFCMKNLP